MAPLILQLKQENISYRTCVTAQHREMLDQVLDFFDIETDYDLNLMTENQGLNDLSSLITEKVDKVLAEEVPDMVLVQGDTTTAMITALAAFQRGIKVGHVEAGLRTYNKTAPFPEEVNRQLISRIADLHFSPTEMASKNLLNEKINKDHIFKTGNTIVDALNLALQKMKVDPVSKEVQELKRLLRPERKMILVTGHRRENFGKGLEQICEALIEIAGKKDIEIVYPVHLNPKVSEPVKRLLGQRENIHLIAPVCYPTMLWLMQKCDLIISDSGGIQEEAPAFGKHVLITRESTERMEGVEAGFSTLVGTHKEKIITEANLFLNNTQHQIKKRKNPYGDGHAAERIVQAIKKELDTLRL